MLLTSLAVANFLVRRLSVTKAYFSGSCAHHCSLVILCVWRYLNLLHENATVGFRHAIQVYFLLVTVSPYLSIIHFVFFSSWCSEFFSGAGLWKVVILACSTCLELYVWDVQKGMRLACWEHMNLLVLYWGHPKSAGNHWNIIYSISWCYVVV